MRIPAELRTNDTILRTSGSGETKFLSRPQLRSKGASELRKPDADGPWAVFTAAAEGRTQLAVCGENQQRLAQTPTERTCVAPVCRQSNVCPPTLVARARVAEGESGGRMPDREVPLASKNDDSAEVDKSTANESKQRRKVLDDIRITLASRQVFRSIYTLNWYTLNRRELRLARTFNFLTRERREERPDLWGFSVSPFFLFGDAKAERGLYAGIQWKNGIMSTFLQRRIVASCPYVFAEEQVRCSCLNG